MIAFPFKQKLNKFQNLIMSENYELNEIIGMGMYGKVYKALNKLENKYYAIKCLNIKDITERERHNIETEVNLLKELKHPNIVLYKDSFLDKNNDLNIVTTFCEGGDMYKKIFREKNTYYEENIIINWLVQLLLGLSYIHDKKIVHRDIKTKNIFIQNENTLRIGDFGIARIFDQTQTINKIVGTPLYMAPECFKQNKKYSFKSDIWSLGCCLYEMCNLKHAFEGQYLPAVSVKISEGKRAPLNKKYSSDLKSLVDSMLDLNPRNRPTIANILERPFMKGKVGEYISDFINNYKKYDGNEEQINILKEQADKFQIFKNNMSKEIKGDIYINKNDKKTVFTMNNIYITNNNKNIDKLKDGKKYYFLDKKNSQNYKNTQSKKDIMESETDKFGHTRHSNNNEDKKRMCFKNNLSPSQYFDFRNRKYLNLIYGKNKDNSKNNIKKINENSKSKKDISSKKERASNALDKESYFYKEKKNQKLFLAMNNDFSIPGRKTDFENHKKMMTKQQSTNNYNIEYEYNDNQENIKNRKKDFKDQVTYSHNCIDNNQDKIRNDKNTSDGFYNVNKELNKFYVEDYNNNYGILESRQANNSNNKSKNNIKNISNNAMNDKNMIINKRINFFKDRCLKSLGNNFYNKAYNYLKNARKNNYLNNDKIREYLSNTFGKNNIGYWQLIDQILFLEDILETS